MASKETKATPNGKTENPPAAEGGKESGENVEWYEKACADLKPLDEAAQDVDENDDSTFKANAVMVKKTLLWPQNTVRSYSNNPPTFAGY